MIIDDISYQAGERAVWVSLLRECLSNLGYSITSLEMQAGERILEREEAISKLRQLCSDFGDNDWPDSLHLRDIIEKHLANHLYK